MPAIETYPQEMISSEIAARLDHDNKQRAAEFIADGIQPVLFILADDSRSGTPKAKYMELKTKAGANAGINVYRMLIPQTTDAIEQSINTLNQQDWVHGMIFQLPFETLEGIEESERIAIRDRLLRTVSPPKDVDGLGSTAFFSPATACSVMTMMDHFVPELENKNVALRGYGPLVNAPLEVLLQSNGAANIRHYDANTPHAEVGEILDWSDVVVTATGSGHSLVPGDFSDLRKTRWFFDAGTAEQSSQIVGDIAPELRQRLLHNGSFVTAEKGSIGPLTVRFLLANTLDAVNYSIPEISATTPPSPGHFETI